MRFASFLIPVMSENTAVPQDLRTWLEVYYQVAIAAGFHLFPSRTEKLSPRAPMVLLRNAGE